MRKFSYYLKSRGAEYLTLVNNTFFLELELELIYCISSRKAYYNSWHNIIIIIRIYMEIKILIL